MSSLRTKTLRLILLMIEPFKNRLNKIHLFKKIFIILYDRIAQNEWIVTSREGVYVCVRDRTVSESIIKQGVYEKGTTKVFRRILKEGMTFVDLGAAGGYYSLIAASLIGRTGKVYSFEPHPFNYELLIRNISFNNFGNIIPIRKAVSKNNCMTKLFCALEMGRHSIVLSEDKNDYIEVEAIALDDFFNENQILPDIIKMDIEGAEILALEGMKRTIEICSNLKMFIEYERNKEELYNFLKDYFDIYNIRKDGGMVALNEGTSQKEDFELNILCIRK